MCPVCLAAPVRDASCRSSCVFSQVLFNKDTEEIVGVHIIGLHAADLIQECSNAVAAGTTVRELSMMVRCVEVGGRERYSMVQQFVSVVFGLVCSCLLYVMSVVCCSFVVPPLCLVLRRTAVLIPGSRYEQRDCHVVNRRRSGHSLLDPHGLL